MFLLYLQTRGLERRNECVPRGSVKAQGFASVFINGKAIGRAIAKKFLAVIFDEKLSFRSHADYIETKRSKYIYTLYKARYFIPQQ